jgi:hypothetical protein
MVHHILGGERVMIDTCMGLVVTPGWPVDIMVMPLKLDDV